MGRAGYTSLCDDLLASIEVGFRGSYSGLGERDDGCLLSPSDVAFVILPSSSVVGDERIPPSLPNIARKIKPLIKYWKYFIVLDVQEFVVKPWLKGRGFSGLE